MSVESTAGAPPAQAPAEPGSGAAEEGLRRPISEADPAGTDPKLTDAFDKLQGEISKLELLSGEEPNWTMVRDGSRTILEQTAKDLRCLMWWSHARFRLEGAAGLQAALAESSGCIKKFAATLHPKRDKARAAALDWLGARFEVDLPLHLKSAPAELIDAVRKSLDEIQAALEGSCASFEGLYRARTALKGVKAEAPKPAPGAAKPAAAPGAPPQPPAAKPAAEPVKSTTPEGLEDLVEQMLERASQLGESALGLRMRRQALWLSAPEAASGDKYQCESVAPKLRWELEAMCNNKKWPELFERCEALFVAHPFCLDLTYWSSQAAGELIGAPAREALAGELVALVIRNPKLPRGTDRTGQPLATNATKSYISSLMAPKTAAAPAPADGASAPAPAPPPAAATGAAPAAAVTDALPAEVEALLAEKKTAEAVRRASAAAAGLSGRAAFCRHLVLAERLEGTGSRELAFPLFRALMMQMRTASLSQWEPLLEARCIRGYLQGARSAKQAVENERELIDALMLLDPGAAVGLV